MANLVVNENIKYRVVSVSSAIFLTAFTTGHLQSPLKYLGPLANYSDSDPTVFSFYFIKRKMKRSSSSSLGLHAFFKKIKGIKIAAFII